MSEGPLISVVDDDMSIRNATQDLLRAAGFSTAAFSNATSFLDSASRASTVALRFSMAHDISAPDKFFRRVCGWQRGERTLQRIDDR